MQILHGTWIPQTHKARSEANFVRPGAFYLWVETTEKHRFPQPSRRHPRQLTAEELVLLLQQGIRLQSAGNRRTENLVSAHSFLLPTVDHQPLPSLELSRYLEEDLPEAFEWQYWQIDCYRTTIQQRSNSSRSAPPSGQP